ncbi:MAG TPA: OmpA family protein [Gammaproteobacteria bacterium]|nr:OmpA family protein [Gammaproteobacteria bacterium]
MDTRLTAAASSAVALLALQGCSHFPENIETLDQARQEVGALEKDPLAQDVAPTRLEAARDSLSHANELYENKEDVASIEQNAYVALRNAQIAEEQIAEKRAHDQLANAQAERDKILLANREQRAQQAQTQAQQAQAQAQQAQQLAQERGAQLEQTQQQLEQQSQQAENLQQELQDLKTEQTSRGTVVTLGDVLFDTDKTDLKAGADRSIDRLADFMKQNPTREILIEGYTDSTGSDEHNRELSAGRARAVKQALVDRGIAEERIRTSGLGEDYPVASNDTSAGRQLNRRVEIVLSDNNGRFASAQRSGQTG